jgi:hypothetical protein
MIRLPLVVAFVPANGSRSSGMRATIGNVARKSRLRRRPGLGPDGPTSCDGDGVGAGRTDMGVAFKRIGALPFMVR